MSFFEELKRRNVIRIALAYLAGAWLLIQVAETLLPIFGLPETTARNLVVAALIGFVPAVILAWVFEWTSEGIRRDVKSGRDIPAASPAGAGGTHRLDRWIIAALIVALSLFAADRFILDPQRDARALSEASRLAAEQARTLALEEVAARAPDEAPPNSIAVLPFVNMSDDVENEYFSDGLAEELLNLLARIPQLAVAARTSSFTFKNSGADIEEIARTLGVSHLLEGSVRKSGDRVRVTAQLINAGSGYHLWSETYERQLDDVFAVQDDIAANVTRALEIAILGEAMPRARATSGDAYSLYLQGLHFRNQSNRESLIQSEAVLQQALQLAPDYYPARVLLGTVNMALAQYGVITQAEGDRRAREAFDLVLTAEPDHPEALSGLAWLAIYRGEFETAEQLLDRALAQQPGNAVLINTMAVLRRSQGRLEEAVPLFRKAMALDPIRMAPSHNLSFTLYQLRRYDEAIESFQHTLQLSPDYFGGWYFLGLVYLVNGQAVEANAAMEHEQYGAWKLQGQAMVAFELGDRKASDSAIAELENGQFDELNTTLAVIHAWRGEPERAFSYFDAAIAAEEGALIDLEYDPLLDRLRSDPRWPEFSTAAWGHQR